MEERDEQVRVALERLGAQARGGLAASDVRLFRRLKGTAGLSGVIGRLSLCLIPGPLGLVVGVATLSFYFALEAQLNHSVMHGAYVGLPGADDLSPERYETMANPFQSKTWGDAHWIHHANPSLLESDPDTVHPLIRVHRNSRWRWWHLLNAFLGAFFTFECWAWDYDRFLKAHGRRPRGDRGELRKFLAYFGYQYALFAVLAGTLWKQALIGTLISMVIRNFVFMGLQTASSVGHEVSTRHPHAYGAKTPLERCRFQVETSKNFRLGGIWKTICGGLDRHIEHHLFPSFPPNRLHALSPAVRELCHARGIRYVEYPSFAKSLGDSLSYLASLRRPS